MKIYVPEDNIYNKCYVVQSEGVIRAYNKVPVNNTTYNYRDYYIRSDYIFRDGTGTWGINTTLPICLSSNYITNNYWYRLDITNILINVTIISLFGIYIPYKIISRAFGRWFRL